MTEITRMQTIILVLKHPKNMHIEFLSISEVAAGKRHDSFQIEARHLHIEVTCG
jgi:hypothetical protein